MNNRPSTLLTRCLRLTRLILHILRGLLVSATVLPLVSPPRRHAIIRSWSRGLLAALGTRLIVQGAPPVSELAGALLVANHVSWMDIQAIHSVDAVRFVAKREIRDWPIFGWLATQADTLFIERTRRQAAGHIVTTIADRLRSGDCICLFPEGTTSDGATVQPFKGSLLQAAIEVNAAVRPVAIRYPQADGNINRNMAYFGDMSLWQSIKRVLAEPAPTVEVKFLPPLRTSGLDRSEIAQHARQAIAQALTRDY